MFSTARTAELYEHLFEELLARKKGARGRAGLSRIGQRERQLSDSPA